MSDRRSNKAQKKPRVLFVNQHYWPDVAATGQIMTDLCEHLASHGFEVEVLAGRGHYVGSGGEVGTTSEEVHEGVKIRRAKTTGFGRGSHVGRIVDYATFYAQVAATLMTSKQRDGVVFLTTPPILPFVGAIAKALRGQRYAVWSMDLHPDAEVAAGMLDARSPLSIALTWAMEVGYRNADLVVDLGAYMKRRIIDHGVDASRTETVHVWSRKEEIEPRARNGNALRQELGVEGKFVVMYSGNAGLVHDFGAVLEAMRRLKDDDRFYFLFVGGGPRKAEIEAFAKEHGLKNFGYRGYFPREQLKHSLSVADAHLISLRAPFVGIAVPGKLYGIMASGRPALFVGPTRCESADTIREHGCGVVVDPATSLDAAAEIVRTLEGWSANLDVPQSLGARGRKAFLEVFELLPNCEAFARHLARVFGDERSGERLGATEAPATNGRSEHVVTAVGSRALN